MKTLSLKLTGGQHLHDTYIFVDDQEVKFKKNEFKNLTCDIETEKDKVDLKIYKALDVGGVWWFVVQILFFVISIFGIFDVYSKKRYLSLEYEGEIELKDVNNLTLSCKRPQEGTKAFEIETDLKITEKSNKFFVDEMAKKKLKILLFSKISIAIVAIVILITVLVVKF